MSRRRGRRNEDSLESVAVGVGALVFVWAWANGTIWWVVAIAAVIAIALAVRAASRHSATTHPTSSDATPAVATPIVNNTGMHGFRATPARAVGEEVAAEDWDGDLSLYSLRHTFFNRTENAFYRSLLRAVEGRYWIFPKVRLLDICNDIPGNVYSARNRIWARHVDFILCHPASLKPVAAIEVDGSSHQRRDRADSDAFKDALFRQLGLPLIRVPASSWFEPADVLRRIEAVLPADQLHLPN